MKIFYIDPNNTTPQINYSLVRALQEKEDIEIEYISSPNELVVGHYPEDNIKIQYIFFKHTSRIRNKAVRRLLKACSYTISHFLLFINAGKSNIEIIHFNWLFFPPIEFLFIKLYKSLGLKVVLTQHEFSYEHKILSFFRIRIFDTVDRIICLSEYIKHRFGKKFADKITVIRHGNCYENIIKQVVPTRKYTHSPNFTILFIGQVKTYKGIDLLVEAMREIVYKKGLSTISLRIKGICDDTYSRQINRMIEDYGLKDYVLFQPSFLTYQELIDEVYNADIGVLPYKSASQSGIPYLFAELHTPLLVTDVGGLPEQVSSEFAEIVPPYSSAIAEGILSLRSRIKEHTIPQEAFDKYLSEHSWQKTASEYFLLYKEITRD